MIVNRIGTFQQRVTVHSNFALVSEARSRPDLLFLCVADANLPGPRLLSSFRALPSQRIRARHILKQWSVSVACALARAHKTAWTSSALALYTPRPRCLPAAACRSPTSSPRRASYACPSRTSPQSLRSACLRSAHSFGADGATTGGKSASACRRACSSCARRSASTARRATRPVSLRPRV